MDTVGIIGVGFVGESLVNIFSKKYNVIGIDTSEKRVSLLRNKFESHKNITIQSTYDDIEKCRLVCISVPTLLINTEVDDSHIKTAIRNVEQRISQESTIVIESSVYIGMTRKLLSHLRKKNIYVGFSPERIDPGRTHPKEEDIPKVISGIDEESLNKIKYFYSNVFATVVPVSSMETAEMCKLTENCFRMINIAYVNEISNACERLGVNVHELINACSTKPFGYMPFYPGLGVGGHCIPINPRWFAVTNHADLPLLMYATERMTYRPKQEAIRTLGKYKPKSILVVGVAFKPGENLTTNSPGLDYASTLIEQGVKTTIYDPLVDMNELNHKFLILSNEHFNTEYIDNNFDLVCVAIKQHNIDWNILNRCNIPIEKYTDV